ncbi:MAG: DUF1801 domain-containing protein [Pseudomonadota bacterium]
MTRSALLDAPAPPAPVAEAFRALPSALRPRLAELRSLIFETAEAEGVGPLTETLKWGEPAYLTEATKSGGTLRLGRLKGRDDACALFVTCTSRLADEVRAEVGGRLEVIGDRAVAIPATGPWDRAAARAAIALALTYKRRKGAAG